MSAKPKHTSVRERLSRDSLFQTSSDLPRIVELDAVAIAPNPEQPRTRVDPEALDELKASIERHGLLQPILVRRRPDGGFVLVAGQRRLEAVRALARLTVPAIVTEGDPGEVALVENLQRQDLDPLEEARGIARLVERFGYNQTEVGQVIGKRQNTVSALLALNRLPDRIRDEVAAGAVVSRSVLVEIAQVSEKEEQIALWEAAKGKRLTIRELRETRKTSAAQPPTPVANPQDRLKNLVRSAERLIEGLHDAGGRVDPELVGRLQAAVAILAELVAPPKNRPRRGSAPEPNRRM